MKRSHLLGLGVIAAAAGFVGVAPAAAGGEDQPIRGWLEHAQIEPSGISLDAKLDTGARTSSIHAEILRGPDFGDDDDLEVEEVAEEDLPQDDDVEAIPETEVADAAAGAEPSAEADATAAPAPAAEPSTDEAADDVADDADADVEEVEEESAAELEEVEVEDSGDDDTTIVFRITNEQGESSTLQREVVRFVEIKNRDGTTERRPVVEITACLAGVWVTGEVNLADREDFNYPFLVGRNMLEASGIVVDAREIYTRSARCSDPAP